jgi:hypothetical protein
MNKSMTPELRYKKSVEEIKLLGYPTNDIFDIDGSPGESEYYHICDYYQRNLEYNYKKYKIDPSIFFLRPSQTINARAIKSPTCLLIATNKGTIDFLFTKFKKNKTLISSIPKLNSYLELEKSLDTPFHLLAYQANQNFTFYHEMGHLVQFSKRQSGSNKISEQSSNTGNFKIQKHVDEIDSDTFSALYASGHVFQYINNYVSDNPTSKDMVKIISLVTATISLYLLSFPSYQDSLYLRKTTHPHVMIRILNIMNVTTDSFIQLALQKGKQIKATKNEILEETVKLISLLSPQFDPNIDLTLMADAVTNHTKSMEDYLNCLTKMAYGDPNSAWRQRNGK